MALLTHDWAAWTLLDDVVGALDLDQERNCSFVQLPEGPMFVAWPQGTEAKAAVLRTEFGELIPDGAPVHLLGHPFSHEQWAARVQRPARDPLTVGETEGFETRAGRFRHCVEEADGVLVAARVRLGCPECTQPRPTKGWEVQESCTPPRC